MARHQRWYIPESILLFPQKEIITERQDRVSYTI
jgi:hypothetical protein